MARIMMGSVPADMATSARIVSDQLREQFDKAAEEAKYASETQKIEALCTIFVEKVNTLALNMIQAMSALKQQKAIAREAALVQQQAFQAASQAMLSYRPPPPAYCLSSGEAPHTSLVSC